MGTSERAADSVYRLVRHDIIRGLIDAGKHLREEELADRFGVSRTPIREALRRLATDGLVEVIPRRGARVVDWRALDVDAIFDLRALVEGFSASRAAVRVSAHDMGELSWICDELDDIGAPGPAGDEPQTHRIYELNSLFHSKIAEVAGGQHLSVVRSSIVVQPLILRMIVEFSESDRQQNNAYHRELIAAFHAGDPVWASATMKAHVLASKHVLIRSGALDRRSDVRPTALDHVPAASTSSVPDSRPEQGGPDL